MIQEGLMKDILQYFTQVEVTRLIVMAHTEVT